jgi:hypothetical protein
MAIEDGISLGSGAFLEKEVHGIRCGKSRGSVESNTIKMRMPAKNCINNKNDSKLS